MTEALTFNHALNVVLPYLCAELNVPQLPDNIRGALNRLRRKRNGIIHNGALGTTVTPAEAMEALCAAAFGFEYVRYVRRAMSGAKN
jgi:hypothetical protein